MLLSDYLKIGESLENIGVFDPILDKDNAFFINIQRLKETTTPEFEGSYDRINDFFRKIIKKMLIFTHITKCAILTVQKKEEPL